MFCLTTTNQCISKQINTLIRSSKSRTLYNSITKYTTITKITKQKKKQKYYYNDEAPPALFHEPEYFKNILSNLPPSTFSMAYGSGVYRQVGYTKQPMIDFIVAVENAKEWHEQNMQRNISHYAFWARYAPPSAVACVQNVGGAHMYYHPFVDIPTAPFDATKPTAQNVEIARCKYGVIQLNHLIDDLTNWTTLFCAGRMHKPFVLINSNNTLNELQQNNLKSALLASLLLLPKRFTAIELFRTIVSISYLGDPRFSVGAENSNKVNDIVKANPTGFLHLYTPFIENCSFIKQVSTTELNEPIYEQDYTVSAINEIIQQLPLNLRNKISKTQDREPNVYINNIRKTTQKSIGAIVRNISAMQHIKGLLSAGLYKSIVYLYHKLKKGFKSKFFSTPTNIDHYLLAKADIKRRPIESRKYLIFKLIASKLADWHVHPNQISAASIGFSVATAISFCCTNLLPTSPIFWLCGATFVTLRLVCNLLDGMVATEFKERKLFTSNPTGDLWNDIPDRISDALILSGLGFAVGGYELLGMSTALASVFTSYVRYVGAESCNKQFFDGLMSKPKRMATVISTSGLCAAIAPFADVSNELFYIPALSLGVIGIGSLYTSAQRLQMVVNELHTADTKSANSNNITKSNNTNSVSSNKRSE